MKSFQSAFQGIPSRFRLRPLPDYASSLLGAADFRFDYAGVSSPARDLRTNVLEKQTLPSGKVVFAIGDTVLMPDPLPALWVRHYLHRSLRHDATNPVQIAHRLNQLIYDCCAAACSLSCFYAEFDRNTCSLCYVNAGHDAPLLVRRNPDEVLRLNRGGPVFGLKESPEYSLGFVTLRAGDRLVAFTQGVIESLAALNPLSAEKALVSLARKQRVANAFELASRIMAECEEARSSDKLEKSVFVAAIAEAISPAIVHTRAAELVPV